MAKANDQVEIVPNEHGAKIRVSANNPEYAHVLLVQNKTWIAPSGWVRQRRMSTLLNGKTEVIKELGLGKKKYLPGQIVIKEQLEPFQSNDPDRDIKYAGDTGVICCKEGEIIYRKCFYDSSGLDTDVLIAHTNGDAIREANAAKAEGTDEVSVDDNASMVSGEEFFTKGNDDEEKEEVDPNQINLMDAIDEITNEDEEDTDEVTVEDHAEEVEVEEDVHTFDV